ncbi:MULTISPECIES: hypothetical protein [unclassified Fibrobacter]|uniref:hypothetical protein n=1 Tax=unclassified Fibrobacter TaxID=2634177 RepID=UPI000D79E75D|nr:MULTISPECIES: hypothetical protein [unclassified Fibrobacter]PWJ62776.1 hypothetical protein BGX12_12065 [Fibrobacter sp. UWR4]PZW63733.1 hypothetical protein C8E88_104113 [Fibrobacter sp. UWR1]
MNRMSRCAALIGTLLSLSGFACGAFAQECEEISLFRNGSDAGKMMEGSTFPEMPEWAANWGNLDGMTPPYIRLSGQKSSAGNWSGEMSFPRMPVTVKGGSLKLKLRSTQKGRAALWLKLSSGKSSTYQMDVAANKTYSVEVPLTAFGMGGAASVAGVGVGLVNVPAYQYTSLFIDDIAFTCGNPSEDQSSQTFASGGAPTAYPYSDIKPESPIRDVMFRDSHAGMTSAAYSPQERKQMADSTSLNFVVDLFDYGQLQRFATATDLTPKQSSQGWFNSLYQLEANRLRDSVIANPKELFYQAEAYAASSDKRAMPLLLANVDYGYRACVDTSCVSQVIRPARLLLAGLPSSTVHGSVFKIFYDPYFLVTHRTELPAVEIKVKGNWVKLAPKSEMEIQFEAAGVQKFQVRLTAGGITSTQTLFVEVK